MSKVVAFLNGAGGAFLLAIVVFGLALAGHSTLWVAVLMAGVLVAYGIVLLVGRRWDVVGVMASPQSDERSWMIHTRAAAAAGQVMALVIVGGFLYDLARGAGDGSQWAPLGAVFGVTYILALLIFVRRA